MLLIKRPALSLLAGTIALLLSASVHADPRQNWRAVRTQTPDTSGYAQGAELRSGDTVPVAISLQLRNRAQLDAYAANLMSGTGTTPLSSEQFLAQYAPSSSDVAAVVSHLRQSGYINIEVSENRLLVTAEGTASTAGKAFNVRLRHYNRGEHYGFANTSDPVVPMALSNIVLSVHGLQTVHVAHTAQIAASPQALALNSTYATAGKVGHSPGSWPAIYNATALPTAAKTSIGIITAGIQTQTLTDLYSFAASAGYAKPVVSIVNAKRVSNYTSTTDNTAEWNIDSQNALGAAGGAVKSIVFYNAASMTDADLTAALNAAVSANVAKVISVSLGACETSARASGSVAADDQIFLAGIAQGQTFVVASGDSGAYNCGTTSAQSYPASSPYVIAVGGTSLTTSSTGAWSSETVWACSSYSACKSGGGTGGGASLIEAAPSWQLSAKVLGTSTRRGVPDLAFAGDPNSGAITLVKGVKVQYGGTSLAAPIFAGFWARIQSANNNKLAFPAPALYKYGASQSALFHDITSGSNGGYQAAKGWDYTSGYGSLNVGAFAAFVTSSGAFLSQ